MCAIHLIFGCFLLLLSESTLWKFRVRSAILGKSFASREQCHHFLNANSRIYISCDFTSLALASLKEICIWHSPQQWRGSMGNPMCGWREDSGGNNENATNIIFNCMIIKNTCISIELWMNSTRVCQAAFIEFISLIVNPFCSWYAPLYPRTHE